MDFSVIVPTYNRPRQLARCLDALSTLRAPPAGFEVVVVDDGSQPPVKQSLRSIPIRTRVRWLRQANGGAAAARNLGIRAARGRFCAFTDDDCTPEPDWLLHFHRAFDTSEDALLGGHTINDLGGHFFSDASQLILDVCYAYYNGAGRGATFFASNNVAVERRRLVALGGFDPVFRGAGAEDRDLCDRWRHHGGPLRHVPGARVRHSHALDLRGFARQHFAYGRGAAHFHAARQRRNAGGLVETMGFHAQLPRLARSELTARPASKP